MNNISKNNLNILSILPHSIGGRLTTSSIIDGLVLNEFNVVVFDELKQSEEEFLNIIATTNFDCIVGYNFSALQLKLRHKLDLKVINYFSDEINKPQAGIGYKDYKKLLNTKDTFNFYWDKFLYNKMAQEITNLFYMPHFVNTDIYKRLPSENKFDVMFAGRLDTDYRLSFILNLMKSMPDYNFAWYAIEKHYCNALSRCSNEEKKLIEKSYQGFIDNEIDMAKAINSSKIILNIHSQGKSSFNYRTFQVLACEKLLISDYRAEAKSLSLDNEIVYYNNFEEVEFKINHYLHNEVDYNEVIKNARARICENHDVKICTKKMIELTQI